MKRVKINSPKHEEIIKFAIVGGGGFLVNMGLLFILTRYLSVRLEIASLIAIEVAILSNFSWNNIWTFRKRHTQNSFGSRLFRYHLVSGLAGIVNYLVLILLVNVFGLHDMFSNLIGITIASVINFTLNSLWTWSVR